MSDRERRPGRPTAARKADPQPDAARTRRHDNRPRQTAVSLWGDEDEPDAVDARPESPRVVPAPVVDGELAEGCAAGGGDAPGDAARPDDTDAQPPPSRGVPPISPIAMDPETTSRTLQASGPTTRPVPTRHSARLAEYHTLPARARAPRPAHTPIPPPPQRLWDEHPESSDTGGVSPNDLAAIEETHFVVSPGRGSERSCGDCDGGGGGRGGGGGGGGGGDGGGGDRAAGERYQAYISGLPHDITSHALCAHIVHASGVPALHVHVLPFRSGGRRARAAIVDFGGARERSHAVLMLNGTSHAGRTLHMRDKEKKPPAREVDASKTTAAAGRRELSPDGSAPSEAVASRAASSDEGASQNSGSEGGADDAAVSTLQAVAVLSPKGRAAFGDRFASKWGSPPASVRQGTWRPPPVAREQPVPQGYTYHPPPAEVRVPEVVVLPPDAAVSATAQVAGASQAPPSDGAAALAVVGQGDGGGAGGGQAAGGGRPEPSAAPPLPRPTLGGDLLGLFESGECADVAFYLGPDETRVDAHRCVLAARSEYFRLHFARKWPDARETAVEYLNVESPPVFAAMLEFIYSDGVSGARAAVLRDAASASELLAAAGRYTLPRLHAYCERALCAVISLDNAAALAATAHAHGAPALERACLDFCARASDDPAAARRLLAHDSRPAVRELAEAKLCASVDGRNVVELVELARRAGARALRAACRDFLSRNLESTLEDPEFKRVCGEDSRLLFEILALVAGEKRA